MNAFTSENLPPTDLSTSESRFAAIRIYVHRLIRGMDRSPERIWSDIESALPADLRLLYPEEVHRLKEAVLSLVAAHSARRPRKILSCYRTAVAAVNVLADLCVNCKREA